MSMIRFRVEISIDIHVEIVGFIDLNVYTFQLIVHPYFLID